MQKFTFNDYFSKCIYINIGKRIDRKKHMIELAEQYNSVFERMNAQYDEDGDFYVRAKNCFKSHLQCLEKYKNESYILIMEDDVIFDNDILEDLSFIMDDFKKSNNDILTFHGGSYSGARKTIIERAHPYGTHCYCVKDPNKLLMHAKDVFNNMPPKSVAIDVECYTQLHKHNFKISTTNKIYASQISSYSDVESRFRDSKSSNIIIDIVKTEVVKTEVVKTEVVEVTDFPKLYQPHTKMLNIPEKIIIIGGGFTLPKEEWLIDEEFKILSINNHAYDKKYKYILDRYDIFLEYTWYDCKSKCEKSRRESQRNYPIVYFHPSWDTSWFKPSKNDFEIFSKEGWDTGLGDSINNCTQKLKMIGKRPSTGLFVLPWIEHPCVKDVILVGFDAWQNRSDNKYLTTSRSGFDYSMSTHNLNIEYEYLNTPKTK